MNQAIVPPSGLTGKLNKNIAQRFSRAAKHYDEHAIVQQQVASDAINRYAWQRDDMVLDVGAGTGNNTHTIASKVGHAVGLDLSPGMVAEAHYRYPHLPFIEGDAAALPLGAEQFTVVFSSMALQWCPSPSLVLREMYRVLKPKGRAVLAIMVDGSFAELQAARNCARLGDSLMPLHTADNWLFSGHSSALQVISHHHQQYTGEFHDVVSLLRSISRVGASFTTSSERPMGRRDLHRLARAYRQALTPRNTLPLSYQILHLTLEKP